MGATFARLRRGQRGEYSALSETLRALCLPGGYASTVTSRGPGPGWAVAFVAVTALLFAPATDEGSPSSVRGAPGPADPRILAPTARDGVVAVRPKLSTDRLRITDRRFSDEPIPLAVVASAAAVLLLWATGVVAPRPGGGRRPVTLRGLNPRGPPGLPAV
jgi:hypothetical protein